MSVLETVTVDNVTYDMHDPKVGSGTLQTTAQTLIPAINELKSGLTTVSGQTGAIGTGTLNTTNKTLIPAVNELLTAINAKCQVTNKSVSASSSTWAEFYNATATKATLLLFVIRYVSGYKYVKIKKRYSISGGEPSVAWGSASGVWNYCNGYSSSGGYSTASPDTMSELGIFGYAIMSAGQELQLSVAPNANSVSCVCSVISFTLE